MKRRQVLNCEWLLWYLNKSESNTCKSKENMKTTLVRVKESESDGRKHENNTRENKGAWKKEFAKLTKMEVQT